MSYADPLPKLDAFFSGVPNFHPSRSQLHLLRGWRTSTLTSYNSAIRRFLRFKETPGNPQFVLPASSDDIYDFCTEIGRTELEPSDTDVNAKTLAKYLYALQAWHLFHDVEYPKRTVDRVKVFLRASAAADALATQKAQKPAVMIKHLMALYNGLDRQHSSQDAAILDCVLCAFWGMARLAEMTYTNRSGPPSWLNSILASDAIRPVSNLNHIILIVRGAKTSKAGDTQQILLNAQPNILCPVAAVMRRLASTSDPSSSLFGYTGPSGERVNLTRSTIISRCQNIWRRHGWNNVSGHSF